MISPPERRLYFLAALVLVVMFFEFLHRGEVAMAVLAGMVCIMALNLSRP